MRPAPPVDPVRVVIIDDTADLRELLRFALERHEFEVVGEAEQVSHLLGDLPATPRSTAGHRSCCEPTSSTGSCGSTSSSW